MNIDPAYNHISVPCYTDASQLSWVSQNDILSGSVMNLTAIVINLLAQRYMNFTTPTPVRDTCIAINGALALSNGTHTGVMITRDNKTMHVIAVGPGASMSTTVSGQLSEYTRPVPHSKSLFFYADPRCNEQSYDALEQEIKTADKVLVSLAANRYSKYAHGPLPIDLYESHERSQVDKPKRRCKCAAAKKARAKAEQKCFVDDVKLGLGPPQPRGACMAGI